MNSYDDFVLDMWLSSGDAQTDINRCVMALCEEAGEVAGKRKKMLRGDSDATRGAMVAELGDLQYYVTMLAHLLGETTASIMQANMRKLDDRRSRGTIKGSGDDR